MKIQVLSIVLVLACNIICYAQTPANTVNAATTLRLNLGQANGAMEKDVFDGVRFIPLETGSKSLFGKISQLEVTDEFFIILDQDTNCILFFDKNGKFRSKIKGGNKSLNPRTIISQFVVNRYKKEVIFKNLGNDVYHIYDFNGKEKGKMPVRSTNLDNAMEFLSGDVFVVSNGYGHTGDSVNCFLSFYDNDKLYQKALPYADADYLNGDVVGDSGSNTPFYYYGVDSTLFFTKSYDNNIYRVAQSNVKVAYRLLFTIENALPADFLTNAVYKGKRLNFIKENPLKVFALSNCYQMGDYLFFKASTYDSNFKKNFIYNLKSRNLISYDRITPDATSYYLPIANLGSDYNNNGLIAGSTGYLYTSVSSSDLINSCNELKDKKMEMSMELTKLIKKNDSQANPVIIELRIKN